MKGRSQTSAGISSRDRGDSTSVIRSRSATVPLANSTSNDVTSRATSGNQTCSNNATSDTAETESKTETPSSSLDSTNITPSSADQNSVSPNNQPSATATASGNTAGDAPSTAEGGPLELPPLDEPLPSDWVTLEKSFTFVTAQLPTHLGPDACSAPSARFNDGVIHLLILSWEVSRLQAFSLIKEIDKGTHINNPLIEYIPVHAFRLTPEPTDPMRHMVVDGEEVEYGPIQASVLPGVVRLMAM